MFYPLQTADFQESQPTARNWEREPWLDLSCTGSNTNHGTECSCLDGSVNSSLGNPLLPSLLSWLFLAPIILSLWCLYPTKKALFQGLEPHSAVGQGALPAFPKVIPAAPGTNRGESTPKPSPANQQLCPAALSCAERWNRSFPASFSL